MVLVVAAPAGARPAEPATTLAVEVNGSTVADDDAPVEDTPTDDGSSDGDRADPGIAKVGIELLGGVSWQEGRSVDATVTVETRRAISGTLLVTETPQGRSTTTYEFTVDLAADSNAVFPVTFTTGWQGVQATATLRSNGEVVADDEIVRAGDGNDDVGAVGVFGIDDPPRRVTELGSDVQLPVLPLDDRLRGLDRVASVVTTPGALRELGQDSDERLRIEAWTRGGGQLVVAGPTASLDEVYHRYPTANPARFSYGAGSILYAEDWADGIPLGGYLGVGGLRELVESQSLGAGSTGELAILADIALPAVAVIAGVLLVYSLLSGPVVFGVLSARRSQRRIWLVLPVLSLVFATAIVGVGFAARRGRSEAHITIVEVNEIGSRATTNLLVTSSFGGNRTIETPPGWDYLGQGRTNGQRPVLLRVGSVSTEISLDMPPGSNAVARLSGVAPDFDGALTIDNARLDGEQLTAQVTNNSGRPLAEAVAFLGNARAEIGALPVGESVEFSVDASDDSGRTMKELLIWPRVSSEWGNVGPIAVPSDRDAATAAGSWTEWRIAQGMSASPENVLGVAAWSDEVAGPVPGIDEGRTVLFARADVSAARRAIDYRTTARLPSHQQPVFEGNFSGFVEDYRVTLGPDHDLDRLGIAVTADSASLSVRTAEGWRFVDLPASGRAEFRIPPEVVLDGEIMIRSYVPEWVWGAGATALVVVDPDEAEPMVLDDQQEYRNGGEGGFGGPAVMQEPPGPGGGPARGLNEEDVTVLSDLAVDEQLEVEGSVGRDSHDAFIVTLEEGQSLVVTMQSGNGDSYLELLTADGELLAANDDYGRNVDSQIQYSSDAAGDYEIRAMDLGNNAIAYRLLVEVR